MSLEIFPTFPKIRADQLDLVDWTQVNALMSIINTGDLNATNNAVNQALSPANLDPAVAGIVNTPGSATRSNILGLITPAFLDPKIADRINTPGTQTRNAINALISASSIPYSGEFSLGDVNWNDFTSTGIWRFTLGGTGGSNIPPIVPMSGILIVVNSPSGISQIVITDDNQIATRRFSGSWSAWRAVLNRTLQINLESKTTIDTSETTLISLTLSGENFGVTGNGWRATLRVTGRIGITSSSPSQVVYAAIVWGPVRQAVVSYPLSTGTAGAEPHEAIFEVSRLLTDINIDGTTTLSLRAWVNDKTATALTAVQNVSTSLRIEY